MKGKEKVKIAEFEKTDRTEIAVVKTHDYLNHIMISIMIDGEGISPIF